MVSIAGYSIRCGWLRKATVTVRFDKIPRVGEIESIPEDHPRDATYESTGDCSLPDGHPGTSYLRQCRTSRNAGGPATRLDAFGLDRPWETAAAQAAERTDVQGPRPDHELNWTRLQGNLHEPKGQVDGMTSSVPRVSPSDFVIGGVVCLTEIHDRNGVTPCLLSLANGSGSDVLSGIASRLLVMAI